MFRFSAFLALFLVASGCASSGSSSTNNPAGGGPGGSGANADGGASTDGFSDRLCDASFCWEVPVPQGNTLHATHAIETPDGPLVFAAGNGGVILRRQADEWRVATTPTSSALRAVFAIAKDDVWAVGDAGVAVHYDGKAFTRIDTPVTTPLLGLWGSAKNDVWAVGEKGAILHWDGKAWTADSGLFDDMHAVWGTGPDDVWAVGGTLNVGEYAHWDGSAWTRTATGLSGAGLYAIAGRSSNDIWAVGEYGHIDHYDGTSWSHEGSAGDQGILRAVRVTDDGGLWVASAGGVWRGSTSAPGELAPWNKTKLPNFDALAISSVKDGGAWFVGYGGAITRIDDDGAFAPEIAAEALVDDVGAFALADDAHAVAVFRTHASQSARLFDGKTWTEVATSSDGSGMFVGMTNDGTGVVARPESDGSQISTYVGGKAKALPKVEELTRPRFAGTSADDIFAFDSTTAIHHWDGAAWTKVEDDDGHGMGHYAAGKPGVLWVAGDGSDSEGRSAGWVGRVNGNKLVSTNFPTTTNLALMSIAVDGDDVWVAGIDTDYSKPKEAGFVHYPHKPVVFHYTGGKWTQVDLPGVEAAYESVNNAVIGAGNGQAFVAFDGSVNVAANGYAYDGSTWTPRAFPASAVRNVAITNSATWIAAEGILKSR